MKNNLTEIVFILDRSGSMYNLTNDTIGGFNSFIEEQKQTEGEAKLTTILFDNEYEILHNGIDINNLNLLTHKEYFTRGSTALLDAMGKTINEVGNRLHNTEEHERPSKVIFVITTDGMENASKEYTKDQIKSMVTHQTETYNWQFIFLGANIDAIGEAMSLGIDAKFASNYSATKVGTDGMFTTMSHTISEYRNDGVIKDNWKNDIK